jgi:hypothetical protein
MNPSPREPSNRERTQLPPLERSRERQRRLRDAEWLLKALLYAYGGICVVAVFPFVMPQRWMAVVHEWLGMGALPDRPIVEYLARATSALCAFYGGLLLVLARDVRRYAAVITYQAIALIAIATVAVFFNVKARLPIWWVINDLVGVWVPCGAMLYLQKRVAVADSRTAQASTAALKGH